MVPSTMANQSYELHRLIEGGDWIIVSHQDTSNSSPRFPGKGTLNLSPQPHHWDHRHQTIPRRMGAGGASLGPLAPMQSWWPTNVQSHNTAIRLSNEALARFTGRVRRDHASLGMTIASWKKSSEMIIDRSYKIADIFERRGRVISRMNKWTRRRILAQNSASAFLEYEFGWVPLVQDIQDSLKTLGSNPPWPFWVKAVARAADQYKLTNRNNPGLTYWTDRLFTEDWKVTVSGKVTVVSENLFLLNRLGLLNLPSVAWDLVPWSFVLNMFGNFNQMISSMSDFAGVTIQASSTTTTLHAQVDQWVVNNPTWVKQFDTAWNSQFYRKKDRVLGIPTPQFMWKVPELNLETLAIAAALPLQRLNKLLLLLRAP